MKTRFFTTAIALMALTFVFNSCEKEDDEPFHFPADQVELLLPDGVVVDTTIRKKDIVSSTNPNYTVVVMVGTEKDNLSTFMGNDKCVLKIDQKYYWQAKVVDSKSGENSEFSEIRTFYVLDPKMKVTMETDNGETESAIVLRWSDIDHNKYKNIKVQMKPTKECGFVGKTFEITNGQDSLYIRLADNPEIPYMFNDFDDLHGINYEPVIYNFILTADVVVADKIFQTHSRPIKEIFLNKKNHVRDHEYNVYRVVEVGDQIWMADDLRCTSFVVNGDTVPLISSKLDYYSNYKVNCEKLYVTSVLSSGAEGILYNGNLFLTGYWRKIGEHSYENIDSLCPINGFHFADIQDWRKLENIYGIERIYEINYPYLSPIIGFPWLIKKELNNEKMPSNLALSYSDYEKILSYVEKYEYYKDSPNKNIRDDFFCSISDWADTLGNNMSTNKSFLNIKPYGVDFGNGTILGQGCSAAYITTGGMCIGLSNEYFGIGEWGMTFLNTWDYYTPMRFVKEIR